ncbi:MAG: hypothetical protein ACIAQF_13390 [Phycisphaerales bacterium JB065]
MPILRLMPRIQFTLLASLLLTASVTPRAEASAGVAVEIRAARDELKPHQPLGLSVIVTNDGESTINFEEYPLGGYSRIVHHSPNSFGWMELRVERPDGTVVRTKSVHPVFSGCGTVCPNYIEPATSKEWDFLISHAWNSAYGQLPPTRSLFEEPGEYRVSVLIHRPDGVTESAAVPIRVIEAQSRDEREAVDLINALSNETRTLLFVSSNWHNLYRGIEAGSLDADLPLIESLAEASTPQPYREYAEWFLAEYATSAISTQVHKLFLQENRSGILSLLAKAEQQARNANQLSENTLLPELAAQRKQYLYRADSLKNQILGAAQAIPVPNGSPHAPLQIEVGAAVDSIGLYELLPLTVSIRNTAESSFELLTEPLHGNESGADYVDMKVEAGWCSLQFVITRPDGQVTWTARTTDFSEREYKPDLLRQGERRDYEPVIGVPENFYSAGALPLFSEPGEYEVCIIAHFEHIRVQSEPVRITVVDTRADRGAELEAVAKLSASGKRVLYSLEAEKRWDELTDPDRVLMITLSQGSTDTAIRAYAQLALSRIAGRQAAEEIDDAIRENDAVRVREYLKTLASSLADIHRLAQSSAHLEVRFPAAGLLKELQQSVDRMNAAFPDATLPELR